MNDMSVHEPSKGAASSQNGAFLTRLQCEEYPGQGQAQAALQAMPEAIIVRQARRD